MTRKKKNETFGSVMTFITFAAIFGGWWWYASAHFDMDGISAFFVSLLFSILTILALSFLIMAIMQFKDRRDKGIDPFVELERSPKPVKAQMLFRMQHPDLDGLDRTLEELYRIFKNYPGWHLDKWEPFRSWYKYQIDEMIKYPDKCGLKFQDGRPYSAEDDSYYDPDAPDWNENYRNWNPPESEL